MGKAGRRGWICTHETGGRKGADGVPVELVGLDRIRRPSPIAISHGNITQETQIRVQFNVSELRRQKPVASTLKSTGEPEP